MLLQNLSSYTLLTTNTVRNNFNRAAGDSLVILKIGAFIVGHHYIL